MSVKEEHYKVVYETGGVIKPTNKDPQEADPSKEKLTPGAHFQEGGEVDDKEKFSEKVRAKADEPNFQETLQSYLGKPLTTENLSTILNMALKRFHTERLPKLDSSGAPTEEPEIDKAKENLTDAEIAERLKKIEGWEPMLEYFATMEKFPTKEMKDKGFKQEPLPDELYDVREVVKRAKKHKAAPTTGSKKKLDESVEKSLEANPMKEEKEFKEKYYKAKEERKKRKEEGTLKKRLGGSVGYSYKNQKYQKPTGDNYASSNRAAQGESFDDITGMGE